MPPTNLSSTDPKQLQPKERKVFWQHHIACYQASHLNRSQYCRTNHINYDCFLYWYHKLKKPTKTPSLIPVHIKQEQPGETTQPISQPIVCSIVLSHGYRLLVHNSQHLPDIIKALTP